MQITLHQSHRESRKRFVIARAWFEEVKSGKANAKDGGRGKEGIVGEGEGEGKKRERDVERAKEMYERAGRDMEVRKGEVERCEGAIRGLKGDVS